jgi:hypothetical protein
LPEQSYAKHTKLVPLFHFALMPVLLFAWIGSFVNLWKSIDDHQRLYSAALIVVMVTAVIATALFARVFALQAQDRAIRAEENFRHYLLTGKTLDPRLTMKQIIGLRFASDDEFPALARKAAESGMAQDEVKKSIKNWKADHDRL